MKKAGQGVIGYLLLAIAFVPSLFAQIRGNGEIAFQGYYLGGSTQPLLSVSGTALDFRTLIPSVGLLSGSFQGYGGDSLQFGENYVRLSGPTWGGRRWDLTGGDFRLQWMNTQSLAPNLFYSDLYARGVRLDSTRGNNTYSFFWGKVTIQGGFRVNLRSGVPQSVMGAMWEHNREKRLQLRLRFTRFSSGADGIEENDFLFPANRRFLSVDMLTFQGNYNASSKLRLMGEVSGSAATRLPGEDVPNSANLSAMVGASYETARWTLRGNYVSQSTSYLPVVGLYAGDRRGPYGEVRFRPNKTVELYVTANRTTNNMEHNQEVATFDGRSATVGASVRLPWKFGLGGSYAVYNINTTATSTLPANQSNNRFLQLNLDRQVHGHNLRLSWRDMALAGTLANQRQKSLEFEDTFHVKRFSAGAAFRVQQDGSEGLHRNTLFFRGNLHADVWRFSAQVQTEYGNDLANKSVFATNVYKTTMYSLTTKMGHGWTWEVDAFRNTLTADLNPESIFALTAEGVAVPGFLGAMNTWNVYFRMAKKISWGGGLPGSSNEKIIDDSIPLIGSVEGFVQQASDHQQPVSGVPVVVDNAAPVFTDENGRFRMPEVREGVHHVSLGADLPADLEPAGRADVAVKVEAKRTARAEFKVYRLAGISGKVIGPKDDIQEVIIRLLPGTRYTTPDGGGNFSFYNLREGEYQVVLDEKSLPENGAVKTPVTVPVQVRQGQAATPVVFEFEIRVPQKPIRKVLEQKVEIETEPKKDERPTRNQDLAPSQPQTPPAPTPPAGKPTSGAVRGPLKLAASRPRKVADTPQISPPAPVPLGNRLMDTMTALDDVLSIRLRSTEGPAAVSTEEAPADQPPAHRGPNAS